MDAEVLAGIAHDADAVDHRIEVDGKPCHGRPPFWIDSSTR
jgi:hypothetical protein